MPGTISKHIRIDEELWKRLEGIAGEEDVTANRLLAELAERWLESHRRRQPEPAIRLTQQQRTAIARHRASVETRRDPAPATGWKRKTFRDTIRHRRAPVSDSS